MKKVILLLSMVVANIHVTNAQITSSFTTDLPNDSVCSNITVTCISTSTGSNLSYQWILDGTASPSLNNDTLVYSWLGLATTGTHTIELEVSDGTSTVYSSYNFVILETPEPYITQLGADLHGFTNIPTSTDPYAYQWYLNGNIISGATSNIYTPILDGDYTFQAVNLNTGCSGLSLQYSYVTTGIADLSINKNYNLYLRDGYLYVDFNKPENLEVYDLLGKQVYSSNSAKHEVSLKDGVYIVRSKEFNKKVIM